MQTIDDVNITQEQIENSIKERDKIINPILNDERKGMWTAFKKFKDHGVFDIVGSNVRLYRDKSISMLGFRQLQASLNIYRNKKFETFRYVLVGKESGKIEDQLAITCQLPNVCLPSSKIVNIPRIVVDRAEEKNCQIVVAHNHPSGKTEPSLEDIELTEKLEKTFTRSDGLKRFAGHIILDHDTFSLYTPETSWNEIKSANVNEDPLLKKKKPKYTSIKTKEYWQIKEIGKIINDKESWNDEFIPVIFSNCNYDVTALKYFHFTDFDEKNKNLFEKKIIDSCIDNGAVMVFPIITYSAYNKIGNDNYNNLKINLINHIKNNLVTDVSLSDDTICSKYCLKPGDVYNSLHNLLTEDRVQIKSTWVTNDKIKLIDELLNHKTYLKTVSEKFINDYEKLNHNKYFEIEIKLSGNINKNNKKSILEKTELYAENIFNNNQNNLKKTVLKH